MSKNGNAYFSRENIAWGATVASAVIGFLAWLFPFQYPNSSTDRTTAFISNSTMALPRAALRVSGAGIRIVLKRGPRDILFQDTNISSSGAEQTLYLPKGQPLSLFLKGAGIEVSIDEVIAPQVHTDDSGTRNQVSIH
jgi:hypothetical protein